MDKKSWQALKPLFERASEAPPDERDQILARLKEECPDLAQELQDLLQEHDHIFIENLHLSPCDDDTDQLPTHIGSYTITGHIGEGGSGRVYSGYRTDDEFRRPVALKLLYPGIGLAPQHRLSERGILGKLQHPNIAQLFDWGVTEEGLHWLATELVPGKPIDQYCEEAALSVRERVTLFRNLCSAVAYLHRHLIVHRDLKPANILVMEEGRVQLLDFGISRVLIDRDAALQDGRCTPEYAAPEQIAGGPITTATDIYSLGMVFHRMLTGQLPFEMEQLTAEQINQRVLYTSMAPPSRCTNIDLASKKAMRGDLDAILLRMVAKDPSERYNSVSEVIDEIDRYLTERPVRARRGGSFYVFRKFLIRNRFTACAAAAGVFAVTAAGTLGYWKTHVATLARESELRRVHQLQGFAEELARSLSSVPETVSLKTREELVQTALHRIESIRGEGLRSPDLDRELAACYLRLGEIQGEFLVSHTSTVAAAQASFLNARRLLESLWSSNSPDLRTGLLLVETYSEAGHVDANLKAGEALIQHAISIEQSLRSRFPFTADQQMVAAGPYFWLGENQHRRGDLLGEVVSYKLYEQRMRDISPRTSYGWQQLAEIAAARERTGIAQIARGDYAAALKSVQSAQDLFRQAIRLSPQDRQAQDELAGTYRYLNEIFRGLGRRSAARAAVLQALRMEDEVADTDPADTQSAYDESRIRIDLGDTYLGEGQLSLAQQEYVKALSLARLLAAKDANGWVLWIVARAANRLAHARALERRTSDAILLYTEAQRASVKALAISSQDAMSRIEEAIALTGAWLLSRAGASERETEQAANEASRAWERANDQCPLCVEAIAGRHGFHQHLLEARLPGLNR